MIEILPCENRAVGEWEVALEVNNIFRQKFFHNLKSAESYARRMANKYRVSIYDYSNIARGDIVDM